MSRKDKAIPAGSDISRRSLFQQAGGAGAAVALSATTLGCTSEAAPAAAPAATPEALETLNATEADALEAICARLIPSDENGPGAKEARAANYIDKALAGPYRALRVQYANGLAAIDEYATATKGAVFAKLSAADQDAVLTDFEKNAAAGVANAAAFFNLLRTHTIEGTFCDPYYGGNANFTGWTMIGYPGLRMGVTADEQRMDKKPEALLKSAYEGGGHGHQP